MVRYSPSSRDKKRIDLHNFGGITRRKRSFGKPRRRWENNIKIHLGEILCEDVEWIDLAQDTGQWRALARTVMHLWVL